MEIHVGTKYPPITKNLSLVDVLPLKVLVHQSVSLRTSQSLDFQVIKISTNTEKTVDFHGYNKAVARERGQQTKPKTDIYFLPLIDRKPGLLIKDVLLLIHPLF